MIGVDMDAIDLNNDTLIHQLDDNPLLNGGGNSLISTEQFHEVGVAAHYVANHHGGK